MSVCTSVCDKMTRQKFTGELRRRLPLFAVQVASVVATILAGGLMSMSSYILLVQSWSELLMSDLEGGTFRLQSRPFISLRTVVGCHWSLDLIVVLHLPPFHIGCSAMFLTKHFGHSQRLPFAIFGCWLLDYTLYNDSIHDVMVYMCCMHERSRTASLSQYSTEARHQHNLLSDMSQPCGPLLFNMWSADNGASLIRSCP